MANKILISVLVLLFLALGGEVFYLFYTGKFDAPSPKIISALSPTPITSNNNPTLVNNDAVSFTISSIEKGLVTSSYFINEYKGKIIEIKNEDIKGPSSFPNYKPILSITLNIENEDGLKTDLPFLFNGQELASLTIKDSTSEAVLTTNDLKVGAEVSLKETYDVIKKITTGYEIILTSEN